MKKPCQLLEDGIILNKSDKLHETKQGGYVTLIKMVDKQGNEIKTLETYIGEVQAGKSMKFGTSATFDSFNVYDFTITKK